MSKQIFLLFLSCLSLSACSFLKKQIASSYLSRVQDQKAKNVSYSPPPSPYQKESHPSLDTLYWNPKTSSSISYFSNCGHTPLSLAEFQKSAFPQEEASYKVKNQIRKKHLYSVLEISSPESSKTYGAIHTFKKGNCLFNLNLVSSSLEAFKAEEPIFKSFIKSFKAR